MRRAEDVPVARSEAGAACRSGILGIDGRDALGATDPGFGVGMVMPRGFA